MRELVTVPESLGYGLKAENLQAATVVLPPGKMAAAGMGQSGANDEAAAFRHLLVNAIDLEGEGEPYYDLGDNRDLC